ncbi:hypothetical protein BN1723_018493, partial [Verticillium longisporum]
FCKQQPQPSDIVPPSEAARS